MSLAGAPGEIVGDGNFQSHCSIQAKLGYWLSQSPRLLLLACCYLCVFLAFLSLNPIALFTNDSAMATPQSDGFNASYAVIISLVAAIGWWFNDLRATHHLAPSEAQLIRSSYRRLRQSFPQVRSQGDRMPRWRSLAANLYLGFALIYAVMTLLCWFRPEISFALRIGMTIYAIAGLLCAFYLRSDALGESIVDQYAAERLLHYRGIALNRASQFYRDVVFARAKYRKEDQLEDFPVISVNPNTASDYWVNIKKQTLLANHQSGAPRRQNTRRDTDTIGYEEERIHDTNRVSVVMFGPNGTLLVPDTQSAMLVDTTRSTINCMLTMEETSSVWSLLRFHFLHNNNSDQDLGPLVSKIDMWLERPSAWLDDLFESHRGERAAKLFGSSAHPRDYLEDIPVGVYSESLDHPHIIVDWRADPLLHEFSFGQVNRISYSEDCYRLSIGDQEIEIELNLSNTQDKPYAREILASLNSKIALHQTQSTSPPASSPIDRT